MLENSTSIIKNQLFLLIEALVLGFVLAAAYDFYRAFRAPGRRPWRKVAFISDFLFWVAATLLCLWRFFLYRWGEIHLYTYIGLTGGASAYFFTLSRYLLPLWKRKSAFCFRLARKAGRLSKRMSSFATGPIKRIKKVGGAIITNRWSRIIAHFQRK